MVDDETPHQSQPSARGWKRERAALCGDEFLNAVIHSVCGDDLEKLDWARAVVEQENTVADFVVSARRALRRVREARGLSMEAAAERAGISTSTLARLETGATAKTDLKLVVRVALLLGVVPRLDFAAPGSAATVTVGALGPAPAQTAGDRRPNRLAAFGNSERDAGGDPATVERRIQELEHRIAAVERLNLDNGD